MQISQLNFYLINSKLFWVANFKSHIMLRFQMRSLFYNYNVSSHARKAFTYDKNASLYIMIHRDPNMSLEHCEIQKMHGKNLSKIMI